MHNPQREEWSGNFEAQEYFDDSVANPGDIAANGARRNLDTIIHVLSLLLLLSNCPCRRTTMSERKATARHLSSAVESGLVAKRAIAACTGNRSTARVAKG